ncbi:MAG TPA: hypothetical protein PK636_05825, partial [bacterium]|nr:hypothetical protein [bacterium]
MKTYEIPTYPEMINEGFDDFDTGTRPAGWTFTNCNADSDVYTSIGNYGVASPSVRLDGVNPDYDVITTTTFGGDPIQMSFWYKGLTTDASSSLLVEELYASSWHTVTSLQPLSTTGGNHTVPLYNATSQVRFTYVKSAGNLAFDDVIIYGYTPTPGTGPSPTRTPVKTPTPTPAKTPSPAPTPPPTAPPTATPVTPSVTPSPVNPTPSKTPTVAPTPSPQKTPSPSPTAAAAGPTPAAAPETHHEALTIATTNIMAFGYRYGEPAQRIFNGLKPDIACMQEFSVQSTYSDVRDWVDQAFGSEFDYYFEDAGAANGIVSRWSILTEGTWEDVGHDTLGRDFAWVVIDIPGEKNLQLVSVHLKAGSTTSDILIREDEASQLKDYMLDEFDFSNHYVALGGDLNAYARDPVSEPMFAYFDDIFPNYNNHIPVDRDGNDNTNSTDPRSEPYDWIMPSNMLDAQHVATLTGQHYTHYQVFPEGHVFDTHIFVPLSDVPPIQYDDLYYSGITHRPVLKSFYTQTRPAFIDEGFDNFGSGVRPSGWTFTGCGANTDIYTTSGYYGALSPSLKLDAEGDSVTTSALGNGTTLKFWMRGSGIDDSSSLLIENNYDGAWVTLAEITYIGNTGRTV